MSRPDPAVAPATSGGATSGSGTVLAVVRFSPRCKHLRLVVRPCRGVELVAPPDTPVERLQEFLDAHAAWAVRTLERMGTREPERTLPEEVVLPAIGERWQLRYEPGDRAGNGMCHTLVEVEPGCLRLTHGGDAPDPRMVHALLRGLLLRRGRQVLPAWLERVRQETGLPSPTRVRIGLQQSLWGSRSSSGTISLSALLLLLPDHLVQHVLVHELCHAVEMRHHAVFHRHLERHDPHSQRHSRQLRSAAKGLPLWSVS